MDWNIHKSAIYSPNLVPQFRGNFLIEALPPLKSRIEEIRELTISPEWSDSISQLDDQSRIFAIDCLYDSFQPIPITFQIKERLDRLLRQGYLNRNPMIVSKPINNSIPSGMSIIGVSGMGKSTTIQRILNTYPQVISHSSYKKQALTLTQVVWLKLNCPYDGSVKGLLYEFFSEMDRLLGSKHYDRMVKSRATVDTLIQTSFKVAQTSALGVLVIDEINHLSSTSSKNKDGLLNFLVTLSNTIGIPIIYLGTPAAFEVLRSDLRQARRTSGVVGDIIWDRHKNATVFELLVKSLFRYQITTETTILDRDIVNTLYYESQGIVDVLKKLYISSEILAVNTGKKKIDTTIIKRAAKENFIILQPILDAMKAESSSAIFRYKDIYIPEVKVLKVTKPQIKEVLKPESDEVESTAEHKMERSRKLIVNLEEDIRQIVSKGRNTGISAYDAIFAAGYIVSSDNDLLEGGL